MYVALSLLMGVVKWLIHVTIVNIMLLVLQVIFKKWT